MAKWCGQKQLDQARTLRDQGMSDNAIAKTLGIRGGQTVSAWLSGHSKPRGIMTHAPRKTLKAGYEAMSVAKAYLLGALVGDGHFDGKRMYTLSACDRDFVEYAGERIKEVYGLQPSLKTYKHRTHPAWRDSHYMRAFSILMADDIRRCVGDAHKTRTWRVPDCVTFAAPDIQAAFARGFFDSEGSVCYDLPRHRFHVQATSVNETGLSQIRDLLVGLGIVGVLHGPRERVANAFLTIYRYPNLALFERLIGFSIARKAAALRQIVAHYESQPAAKRGAS